MKITFRRCTICDKFHNHLSCPYCGAMHVAGHIIDVANGRELVRSRSLPRVIECAETITRINPTTLQQTVRYVR